MSWSASGIIPQGATREDLEAHLETIQPTCDAAPQERLARAKQLIACKQITAFVVGNALLATLGQQPISGSMGGHVPPEDAPDQTNATLYCSFTVLQPEPQKSALVQEIEQMGGELIASGQAALGIGGSAPSGKAAAFSEALSEASTKALSEASTEVPGIGDVGGKEDDALIEPPPPAYANGTARCDATASVEAEAAGAST